MLRRAMRWVAGAAALLLVLRAATKEILPPDTSLGATISVACALTVAATLLYYGFRATRWGWRRLLWRVRRRLVITYLFVGLTPIVLMGALGLLLTWGTASEAMARVVTVQLRELGRQAGASAAAIARELAAADPGAGSGHAWLKEWTLRRAVSLRAHLPEAGLIVWDSQESDVAAAVSWPEGASPIRELEGARPGWLSGCPTWSGMAFLPAEAGSLFGASWIGGTGGSTVAGGGKFCVLIVLSVDRPLVERLRAGTGLRLQPFFMATEGSEVIADTRGVRVAGDASREPSEGTQVRIGRERGPGFGERLTRDQFGEPLPDMNYLVVHEAANWKTGQTSTRLAFLFDWTAREAARQLFGSTILGRGWKIALGAIGILFLGLELAALFVATLMTREVTGTVHELYEGTEVLRKGDFSHRVRVRSDDQLGALAHHFNDMSAHIESLLEERVKRQRLEQEVEIAAQVQAQLFPRTQPRMLTSRIAAECRAARGVAGDYYDYMEVAPGVIALVLGDVSGKGLSASLVMSNLQASVRAQTGLMAARGAMGEPGATAGMAGGPGGTLARLAQAINSQICASIQANRFATLFLALYEDASGRLVYVNAGHNAPILAHADGSIERLTEGGMVMGILDSARFREGSARLRPGSALVVFSDGISEAENPHEDPYGEETLARLVAAHIAASARGLLERIFAEVDRWSGGLERGDDQTLVILKMEEEGRSPAP